MISAPAGFGKTTLVTEWLISLDIDTNKEVQAEYKIAWLSLDEKDNNLVRFLTYLIAALSRSGNVDENFGKGTLSILQSIQPPPIEVILAPLINDIAAISEKTIFVLDDYHVIETQLIHDALGFLLENIPPQFHLVISTREDPYLPLARLRARDQLTEIRAADLRFTHLYNGARRNGVKQSLSAIRRSSVRDSRRCGGAALASGRGPPGGSSRSAVGGLPAGGFCSESQSRSSTRRLCGSPSIFFSGAASRSGSPFGGAAAVGVSSSSGHELRPVALCFVLPHVYR